MFTDKDTIPIFSEVQKQLKDSEMWFVDSELLSQWSGPISIRCECLYKRADSYQKKLTQENKPPLIMIFDHISHAYSQSIEEDTGVIWTQLQRYSKWKKNKDWKLFIVEQNPALINIRSTDYTTKMYVSYSMFFHCILWSNIVSVQELQNRQQSVLDFMVRFSFKTQ